MDNAHRGTSQRGQRSPKPGIHSLPKSDFSWRETFDFEVIFTKYICFPPLCEVGLDPMSEQGYTWLTTHIAWSLRTLLNSSRAQGAHHDCPSWTSITQPCLNQEPPRQAILQTHCRHRGLGQTPHTHTFTHAHAHHRHTCS